MRVSEPLILGIESTCDETGAALVRGRELLGDAVATSMDAHARFGGCTNIGECAAVCPKSVPLEVISRLNRDLGHALWKGQHAH